MYIISVIYSKQDRMLNIINDFLIIPSKQVNCCSI